jgi:hypothetical protein
VKEKVTERQIVRRIILYEAIDREISKALEEFSPRASERASEYERQLLEFLRKRGIMPDEQKKRRGGVDFVFGTYRVAVDLKAVRDGRAISRLADKLSRQMDQYDRVFAVVVDETGKPEKTRRGVEELEEMNREKLKVILKKPRRKKRKQGGSRK